MLIHVRSVQDWLLSAIQTRQRALTLVGLAFLSELAFVLAGGKALLDYEAAAALWAALVPLGMGIVIGGLPAVFPGAYQPRRLFLGAAIYALVGALVGLVASQASETDGSSKFLEPHEAIIAGLAWPVGPFLLMLQAMRDGLGWYS